MAEDRTDLETLLAESEALLAAWQSDGGSDPRASEQIAAALYAMTWAQFKLERTDDSLQTAERLAAHCTEHGADAVADHWLADALLCKRAALSRLGRSDEAAAVDAESIIRFRDAEDPGVRLRAAGALSSRSGNLLGDPARFAQGMALSDELLDMLAEEPEDSVLPVALVAAQHMRLLMNFHSQTVRGLGAMALELTVSNAVTAAESIAAGLMARTQVLSRGRIIVPTAVSDLPGVRAAMTRLTPPGFHRTRARALQALKVSGAVLGRLESLGDADGGDAREVAALRARTELSALICLAALGRGREAVRATEAMHERRDPIVAGAYQTFFDELADHDSALGQLGSAAMLAGRAQALIGDDPVLARIAYEDSLAAQLPAARPWPLRWLLARMAPGG